MGLLCQCNAHRSLFGCRLLCLCLSWKHSNCRGFPPSPPPSPPTSLPLPLHFIFIVISYIFFQIAFATLTLFQSMFEPLRQVQMFINDTSLFLISIKCIFSSSPSSPSSPSLPRFSISFLITSKIWRSSYVGTRWTTKNFYR